MGAIQATPLQTAYDISGDGTITLDAANGPLSIVDNAVPLVGDLFRVRNNTPETVLAIQTTEASVGLATQREIRIDYGSPGERGGIEHLPDDFTQTILPALVAALQWDSVVTSLIPGGGPIGNDTAPAMVAALGTCIFADQGNLFASSLLFNQATRIEARANVGPVYTLVNQPQIYAGIAGAFTCSQHNALRIQPNWGGFNVAGGTITQTSAVFILNTAFVDATVGAASVTSMIYWQGNNPTLTAGGTIGTLVGIDIANLSAAGTNTGIRASMTAVGANRLLDFSAATSISEFGGDLHMNNSVPLVLGSPGANRVEISRPLAGTMRWQVAGGVFNEGLDWDFDSFNNNIAITSPTTAGLNFDLIEIAFGPSTVADGTNNWVFAFSPGLRGTNLAGDYSEVLFTSSAAITVVHAITNFATWTVNAPTIVIGGGGSIVNAANVLIQTNMNQGTNRYGLLITSAPAGPGLNYALRCTAGDARFDARVDINNGIALGGGAVATLGTIGGAGPTVAAQAQWLEVDIAGVAHWIAVWV